MFVSPDYINILNRVVDNAESVQFTPDQATLLAIRESTRALVTALTEQYELQGKGETFTISPMVVHGLIDMILWINDRLEISLIKEL